jgi:hypothetical protein
VNRWRIGLSAVVALGLLPILAASFPATAGRALASAAGPCLNQPDAASCNRRSHRQATSPEQQLADAFAPIVMLKRQEHECDRNGEAYLPAPVEIVFDDPQVALRRIAGRSRTDNETVKMAPGASDLMGTDDTYFLDFPGNPRRPRCDFERWFRQRMAGHEPAVYANVITTPGHVVVQYWFWYVFNDFNNTHEGDWEMIQLVFDVASAAEALNGQPVEVGYSSHGGGERAAWTDEKLTKEGNHPVVYPGAGSHANKFGSGVYMAWGEDNSGFGCDVTTGPSDRIEPTVILAPHDLAAATGPVATLAWLGRWGERQPAFYNGPNSPGVRERWTDPFPWQDGLRDGSLRLPESVTFGPGPTSVFCTTVGFGSFLLTRWAVYPWLIVVFFGLALLVVVLLARIGASTLLAAWRTYVDDWRVFVAIGLVLIPLGLLANLAQFAFVDYPPGKQLFQTMDASPGSRLAIALTIGGLQDLLGLVLVAPAVIAAVGEVEAGRRPTFAGAYRLVFARIRPLVGGVGRSIVIVTLLALSVVGIPWAISRAVRWLFVSQAVLLDGEGSRQSLTASARAVAGHWWRTAGNALFFWFVGVAPGPLIGLALLILAKPEVRYVNWLSSLIYAVLLPLSVIGMTLLYRNLKRDKQPTPNAASRTDRTVRRVGEPGEGQASPGLPSEGSLGILET